MFLFFSKAALSAALLLWRERHNIINNINIVNDISNDIINEPSVVFVKFCIYWNFHKLYTPKNIVEEKRVQTAI